jgi:hypothetical protein
VTPEDPQTITALTMDLADVHGQLSVCAALVKGIQERLARLASSRPLVVQDVSGAVFPRED